VRLNSWVAAAVDTRYGVLQSPCTVGSDTGAESGTLFALRLESLRCGPPRNRKRTAPYDPRVVTRVLFSAFHLLPFAAALMARGAWLY
jgi:hypothetical protein